MCCIGAEKRAESSQKFVEVLRFTFPDDENVPTKLTQGSCISLVSCEIAGELFLPEKRIGFGFIGILASPVLMPEAAVDEDHFSEARKHDIGGAREVAPMQTKPVAKGVSHTPHESLWFRILPLNARHQSRAFCRRDDIHNHLSNSRTIRC